MTRHHLINGIQVPFTAQEEAQRDQEEANWEAGTFDRAIEDLRQRRNSLLSATDFHALSDNTMSADMTTYRQNLRDLTNGLSTVEDVNNITWPTKP